MSGIGSILALQFCRHARDWTSRTFGVRKKQIVLADDGVLLHPYLSRLEEVSMHAVLPAMYVSCSAPFRDCRDRLPRIGLQHCHRGTVD